MNQFVADRHTTPATPALNPVNSPKVPVYDTLADVEADLANLSEGQIVATGGDGSELPMPVDVVEEGNMHAVTSNAVAELLDWKYKIVPCAGGASGNVALPASYDGNYEYDIYDYKYHVTRQGIHLKAEGTYDLGCFGTNYAGISNDFIRLKNDAISYVRESTAGDYRIAYRPLPNYTAL